MRRTSLIVTMMLALCGVALAAVTHDLGALLTTTGTNITTSYTGPSTGNGRYVGGSQLVRYDVQVHTGAASNLTGVTCKLQVSTRDGTTAWTDLASINDATGTTEIEHAFTGISSSGDFVYTFRVDPRAFRSLVRVMFKSVGGAGKSGESVTISAAGYVGQ